jgi:hypothetical protein
VISPRSRRAAARLRLSSGTASSDRLPRRASSSMARGSPPNDPAGSPVMARAHDLALAQAQGTASSHEELREPTQRFDGRLGSRSKPRKSRTSGAKRGRAIAAETGVHIDSRRRRRDSRWRLRCDRPGARSLCIGARLRGCHRRSCFSPQRSRRKARAPDALPEGEERVRSTASTPPQRRNVDQSWS